MARRLRRGEVAPPDPDVEGTEAPVRLDYLSEGRVAQITLNRPQARNAMTFAMYERLAEICRDPAAHGDPRVIITMPTLRKLIAEGAGEKILTKLNGPRVDISYKGAGRLAADGQVDWLRLKAQGVGEVDTKALLAKNVDVNFEGIGSVKVYSSGELNAVVRGMGELTYYGKPKIVHKSVAGIGSVNAAK